MDALLVRLGLAADAVGSAPPGADSARDRRRGAVAGADGPVPADVARADFTRSLQWLLGRA